MREVIAFYAIIFIALFFFYPEFLGRYMGGKMMEFHSGYEQAMGDSDGHD